MNPSVVYLLAAVLSPDLQRKYQGYNPRTIFRTSKCRWSGRLWNNTKTRITAPIALTSPNKTKQNKTKQKVRKSIIMTNTRADPIHSPTGQMELDVMCQPNYVPGKRTMRLADRDLKHWPPRLETLAQRGRRQLR